MTPLSEVRTSSGKITLVPVTTGRFSIVNLGKIKTVAVGR